MSKTFDNGVVCASEQAVIVVTPSMTSVKERFATHNGYVLTKEEADKVRKVILINGAMNATIVGQPANKIAELSGVTVPTTKILIGEGLVCDERKVRSREALPDPGYVPCQNFEEAVEMACTMVNLGGIGHTSGLYTDQDIATAASLTSARK
ncbi:hypothetical protein ACLK19_08460 [Escherichia coli]